MFDKRSMFDKFMPGEMISKAAKKRDIVNSVLVLLVASILFAVGSALSMTQAQALLSAVPFDAGTIAVSVFFIVLIGGLFFGWVVALTVKALAGKGGFFEGLTSVAYSMLYLSKGMFLAAIFTLIPNAAVTAVLSFAAIIIFGVLGYATLFRGIKELFGTDLLTAFIAVSVIFGATMFGFYILALGGAASGLLGSMPLTV